MSLGTRLVHGCLDGALDQGLQTRSACYLWSTDRASTRDPCRVLAGAAVDTTTAVEPVGTGIWFVEVVDIFKSLLATQPSS